MNQEDKHIRKKLQEILEDYENEPPVSWDNIDNELTRYYILKRKRYLIVISIFLITIITFISLYINYKTLYEGDRISYAFRDKNTQGPELFSSPKNRTNSHTLKESTTNFNSKPESNFIKVFQKDTSHSPNRFKNLISLGSAILKPSNQNYFINNLNDSKDSSLQEKVLKFSDPSILHHGINNRNNLVNGHDLNIKKFPSEYSKRNLCKRNYLVNVYKQSILKDSNNLPINSLELDSFTRYNKMIIGEILELGKVKSSLGNGNFLSKVNSSLDSVVSMDTVMLNSSVINISDSLIAKGNAKSTQSTNRKKVTIGLSITPQQVFRSVNGTTETYKKLAEVRNNRERAKYGISIDLSILYRVTNNFELGSGVNYSTLGYKGHLYNLFNDDDQKYDNTFSFIGIPLLSNLQFGKQNINVSWSNSVLMSINTNSLDKDGKQNSYFYDKGKGEIIDDDDHLNNSGNNNDIELINPSYQYRSIMFSYGGALLLNFKFFSNSKLSVGPSLNYYFSSMYKNHQIRETPYSYGLKVGYSYSF